MRELELLQHIYRSNPGLPVGVVVPPGDDMGAVTLGSQTLLVTVDQVADGVHFDLNTTPIEKIGRKAITRNLSDVAAMAAVTVGAVAAACLPKGFGEDRAKALFDAMRRTADAYDCPLIGGDISTWDQRLILTVTVFARPGDTAPVLRSGAMVGDTIYVTGALGGCMQMQGDPPGYVHHLDFEPRITLAGRLAQMGIHSMIDLSDGLAKDLPRICKQSDVSAELDVEALPVSKGARLAMTRSGRPAWQHALGDGEDYELCFTAPSGTLPASVEGVPITAIGRIVAKHDGPCVSAKLSDGTAVDLSNMGWEHTG